MDVLAYVLAAASVVAPGRDHSELGGAIARKVTVEAPLFADADDAEKKRTSALLVAIAFRESSLRNAIDGDHDEKGVPTSFCAFQVHLPGGARTKEGWSGEDLKKNVDRCVTVAFRLIRSSIGECRAFPLDERLAWYARGRCDSKQGHELSRDRMALAREIAAKVAAPPKGALFLRPGAARFCAMPRRSDELSHFERRSWAS